MPESSCLWVAATDYRPSIELGGQTVWMKQDKSHFPASKNRKVGVVVKNLPVRRDAGKQFRENVQI
ncbi:hypothetical protein OAL43_00190 [bacterium]|nr:hypothetical protein [Rubripirellula sp.]MDB4339077.1 hypothetical protein [Rubripirellula sp.]MDC0278601.1 hypothetical protein [bacterium]